MSVLLDGRATDIIQTRTGKYVYIDTCWTIDHGWETMVFTCDKNGNVTSWVDIDVMIYATKTDADEGHTEMINKWLRK